MQLMVYSTYIPTSIWQKRYILLGSILPAHLVSSLTHVLLLYTPYLETAILQLIRSHPPHLA